MVFGDVKGWVGRVPGGMSWRAERVPGGERSGGGRGLVGESSRWVVFLASAFLASPAVRDTGGGAVRVPAEWVEESGGDGGIVCKGRCKILP